MGGGAARSEGRGKNLVPIIKKQMKAAHGSCLSVSAYLDRVPLENQ